jgi:TonB-dependent SusC/RagA subfamily outer membrane receptor
MRLLFNCLALALIAPEVAAQGERACPLIIVDDVVQQPTVGPGEAFGVTAYQCASCSTKTDPSGRTEYSFSSEPVVLQTTHWTPLRPGDVIEAVNGKPITTRAGAEQFTYPPVGENVLALRRGATRTELRFTPKPKCADLSFDPNRIESVEVLKGGAAASVYGAQAREGAIIVSLKKDTAAVRGEPARHQVVRSSEASSLGSAGHGRYGFALSCQPSCTRVKANDGTDYWKFDGPPPIAGIIPGQPAALAGLRVGDVVVDIDGLAITSEEGALRFQRSDRRESIQVTIERDGKRSSYILKAR